MRALILLLSLALLCGGCATWVREYHKSNSGDLAILMGSPEETGFLIIDCDMIEKENKFLAPDETEAISLGHCSVVRKGRNDEPIQGHAQRGYFVFPNLKPGRYCIKAIHGHLPRLDDKDDEEVDEFGIYQTKVYKYEYEFPLWNVREVIFEVAAGVPTYFGKIIITEPYRDYLSGGRTRRTTVRSFGKSEKAEIESSTKHEKTAWESFLWLYPESAWSEAVRERLGKL